MPARRVIVEADGGSRGNPGDAAYGALVRDADTGEVIAERAETIGIATNNVAEYSGLIAGLELVADHVPEAEVEVRMDSKLVIEQMAGRWKIKHPDMRPLAVKAQGLAPFGTEWTWVPRAQNSAADALLNAALDAAQGKTPAEPTAPAPKNPLVGWRDASLGEPVTVIALRHGITPNTLEKRFCGSGGSDPGLTDEGVAQAERAAAYLARRGGVDAIVSSPLRRTQETAQVVGDKLGVDTAIEDGFAEAAFGEWDGLTFAEVKERWPEQLEAWLSSTAVAPKGGEPFDKVYKRVGRARERIVETYAGKTVVVVSHVTPIKMLVRIALGAPMQVIYRMELAPASLTTIQWWPDGTPSLRAFSYVPE
ncbi:bifunctional RNase H/acid phosphatase [Solicola gregarius]|uniref:Bifunctional RNase H/acid phosphatase n=1 Tax=Solicola gregarius TaxID=2908642 RepID=A0AA46THY3_9ACTN|nr:bifunctional RNase H/acid phosphatase [Solicola gregarius]UYM05590.1 bifunctional RNase H/acid phosphatase [Solicola gregarius]